MSEGRANAVVGGEGYPWSANGDNQIDLHAAVEAQSWDQFIEEESARKAAVEAQAIEAKRQAAVAEMKELTPQQQVEQILNYGVSLQTLRKDAMQPEYDLAA